MDILRKYAPKEKRPQGRQPKWTSEFMWMVAQKVVEEGMTYREASKTFNLSSGSVSAWVSKFRRSTLSPLFRL